MHGDSSNIPNSNLNEMNEALRKQFEMNCGAVLDKSNKIHGDNRQLIINFLGGHHTKPERNVE